MPNDLHQGNLQSMSRFPRRFCSRVRGFVQPCLRHLDLRLHLTSILFRERSDTWTCFATPTELLVHPFLPRSCDCPTCKMNRLFGAKNTAPKPTLNQAIEGVGHAHRLQVILADAVLGRRPYRFHRCQTRQNQCRTLHIPAEDVEDARRSGQTSNKSQSLEGVTEAENV